VRTQTVDVLVIGARGGGLRAPADGCSVSPHPPVPAGLASWLDQRLEAELGGRLLE